MSEPIFSDEGKLVAGVPLPSGPLSAEDIGRVARTLIGYLKKNEITPGRLSHEIGTLGEGEISDFLAGKFGSEAEADARALNAWVELHARRAAGKTAGRFVETKVAKMIRDAARLTLESQTIGLIFGPAGIGKSRCGKVLAETTPGAIFLRSSVEGATARALYGQLADYLKVRSGTRSQRRDAGSVVARVFAKLQDSGRLIIIDEAHRLSESALEGLRDLNDAGLPILLICTKDLHQRVLSSADMDHGQFASRVGIIFNLISGHDILSGDSEPLFSVEDIRKIFEIPTLRLAAGSADYLKGVANDFGRGSLRLCGILVGYAAIAARNRSGLDSFASVTLTARDLEATERAIRRDPAEVGMIEDRRRRGVAVATA